MAKETDKIISSGKGVKMVSAKAKSGVASFAQYGSLESLTRDEKPDHVVTMFNRMTRVDAINTVNRPDATPSPIRELGKLAKAVDAATQAEIIKATQAIIDRAKAKAESSK